MKFISVKALASGMKKARMVISREKAIITYNGKPIAMVNPLNEENFEYMVREGILNGFKDAVEEIRSEAGKAQITEKDVKEAVKAVRRKKRTKL